MKVYKRAELILTAFDEEDVITTSGDMPETTSNPEDPIGVDYGSEDPPGTWW